MKKKIGSYKNHPVVICEKNEVRPHELLYTEAVDGHIQLMSLADILNEKLSNSTSSRTCEAILIDSTFATDEYRKYILDTNTMIPNTATNTVTLSYGQFQSLNFVEKGDNNVYTNIYAYPLLKYGQETTYSQIVSGYQLPSSGLSSSTDADILSYLNISAGKVDYPTFDSTSNTLTITIPNTAQYTDTKLRPMIWYYSLISGSSTLTENLQRLYITNNEAAINNVIMTNRQGVIAVAIDYTTGEVLNTYKHNTLDVITMPEVKVNIKS